MAAGRFYECFVDDARLCVNVKAALVERLVATQRAAVALDVSMSAASIATGHCDHLLRVWDARMQVTRRYMIHATMHRYDTACSHLLALSCLFVLHLRSARRARSRAARRRAAARGSNDIRE